MIPEKEELEMREVFFQVLLLAELFTPLRLEDEKKCFSDFLRKCGITLNGSEYMILDHSRIGNSTVTIIKYNLDYRQDRDSMEKRVCVEGTAAIQTDELGNTHIRLSSKTDPFRRDLETTQPEASLINGHV